MRKASIIIKISLFFAVAFAVTAQSNGKSILIIGDSNTEHGYITNAHADTLRKFYGVSDTGSGYMPLNAAFYLLVYHPSLVPGITVSYPTSWKLYDMFEGTRLAPPYLSPNGHWLKTASQSVSATVTFRDNGVNVYWLTDSLGGSFQVIIDNQVKAYVPTGGKHGVEKTSVTGLTSGTHTMLLKSLTIPAQGGVALLGFDAHSDRTGQTGRPVVHNWGNGYAA